MAKKATINGKANGQAKTAATPRVTGTDEPPLRLQVRKTYKIFIGGKFPRTESGRYYQLRNDKNEPIANVCLSSRKDFREAVVAARAAQSSWASKSAYNRGQILYRLAEMLEGRYSEFMTEHLLASGSPESEVKVAAKEVRTSIERLLYYAGWADKYQQVFSSVNPVSSSHFNFSVLEPTGVVAAIAPQDRGLLGLVSLMAPAIVGGNTVVLLASKNQPLTAVTFAEVIATSDVPGGVVNILTGDTAELVDPMSTHMDVNAVLYAGDSRDEWVKIRTNAALNVKRVVRYADDWLSADAQSPYKILDVMETKTTWHPVGI